MQRKVTLDGVTVIVTRPREQAGPLCRALERQGARVARFACIEIEPLRPTARQRRVLESLGQGDWAVFTSSNAVRHAIPYLRGGALPPRLNLAAVGAATARALRGRGAKDILTPRGGGDSEALLELLTEARVRGRRAAILKGRGGRRLLGRVLRRRGAEVHTVPVYRRERPNVASDALGKLLPRTGRVVTTATSGEILLNLTHMADAATLERLMRSPLVVVSERVAGLARWSGFQRIEVARGAGPAAVTRAAAAALP